METQNFLLYILKKKRTYILFSIISVYAFSGVTEIFLSAHAYVVL